MNQLVQSKVICYIFRGKTVQRTCEFKLRSVFTFSGVNMLGVNSEISLLIQSKFIFTVSEVKQLPIRGGTVDNVATSLYNAKYNMPCTRSSILQTSIIC